MGKPAKWLGAAEVRWPFAGRTLELSTFPGTMCELTGGATSRAATFDGMLPLLQAGSAMVVSVVPVPGSDVLRVTRLTNLSR